MAQSGYNLVGGYHYQPENVGYGQYAVPGNAQLAWPTEIPVKLRIPICCEKCKRKLAGSLRDVEGVYDVGIQGMANAVVSVTGTASKLTILERARTVFTYAEPWSED